MGQRVLVADDDPTTLASVAHAMELLGYEVSLADDGDEFLQLVAEEGPFDLLVTDVSMPWMTGLQVAHSVRAAGVDTPVVVMTALAVIPAAVGLLGPNAVLLRKPFGMQRLRDAVEQVVRVSAHTGDAR
jgi:DNA-binding NtrC family response regulator